MSSLFTQLISSSANQSFVVVCLNVISKVKSPKSNLLSLSSHTDSLFHWSSEHLSRLRIQFIWILYFLYDPSCKSPVSEVVSPQWIWCACFSSRVNTYSCPGLKRLLTPSTLYSVLHRINLFSTDPMQQFHTNLL